MMSMLPPEIASMLGATMQLQDMMEEPEEPEEAQHPCAREVNACVRETGCNSRSAIEGCLIKHFTQLSAECKCFVHHITNGRVSTAAAQPRVIAVARPVAASSPAVA